MPFDTSSKRDDVEFSKRRILETLCQPEWFIMIGESYAPVFYMYNSKTKEKIPLHGMGQAEKAASELVMEKKVRLVKRHHPPGTFDGDTTWYSL